MANHYGKKKRGRGKRVGCIGTVDSRAQCLPKEYFKTREWINEQKNMEQGDFVQFFCKDWKLILTVWKDVGKVPVLLLDNCIDPFRTVAIERRKGRDVNQFNVPYVCKVYNQFMGEVDAASAHRATFAIDRQQVRCHKNLLLHFWSGLL